jgi:hypothetical protein
MNHSTTPLLACLLAAIGLIFGAHDVKAQGKLPVTLIRPAFQVQKTPKFSFTGPKDKKYTQKTWLEFEVPFAVPKGPKGATAVDLTFTYYVMLQGKTKALLTTEISHSSVPLKAKTASVVYLSPQEIAKLAGGKVSNPKGLVKAWGVEITHGGEIVQFFDSRKSKSPEKAFWNAPEAIPKEGALLPKKSTPFAPLWFDYHAEVDG